MPGVADDFIAALKLRAWPGNVRELLNVLERCLIQHRVDRLEAQDLEGILDEGNVIYTRPAGRYGLAGEIPGDLTPLEQEDRARVEDALDACGGNVARAARELGISRSTLRYRLKKFGLEPG